MSKLNGYKSKTNKRLCINADINAAINIMRKYCKKNKVNVNFKKLIKNNINFILNPIKMNQ